MKILFALLLSILIGYFSSEIIVTQEFLMDLGRTNQRINGELLRYKFKGSLDTLSYDYYIKYLSENERVSGKGVANKIKSADSRRFLPGKEWFVITLYYEKEKVVISDNSKTRLTDTLIRINKKPGKMFLKELEEKIYGKKYNAGK